MIRFRRRSLTSFRQNRAHRRTRLSTQSPIAKQSYPAHPPQRRSPRPTRPAPRWILLVHRRRRHQGPGLSHQAPRLRPQQEISGQVPDPRRPARRMGRLVVLPLERRTLRRQRLRRRHDQSPRIDGLRAGLCRWCQRRLGRQALHRPDGRASTTPSSTIPSSTRPASARSARAMAATWPTGSSAIRTASSASSRTTACSTPNPPSDQQKKTGSTSGNSKAIPGTTTVSPTQRIHSGSGRPSLSAKNFKTPTLVVHSQLDYRLDVSEGFQLFDTLQLLKVPSKMLYFPDEGHWVLKPQNSQLWYKTVNDWVDQWTKEGH